MFTSGQSPINHLRATLCPASQAREAQDSHIQESCLISVVYYKRLIRWQKFSRVGARDMALPKGLEAVPFWMVRVILHLLDN